MYDRVLEGNSDIYYLTVDAARQGKDGTEIGIWKGLELFKVINIAKADLVTQAEKIEQLIGKY